jgi:hypothetical protein
MNDLDALMNADPVALLKDREGLKKIIAYYRSMRGEYEEGSKPQKTAGPKIDLKQLGLKKGPAPMRRRI